MTDKETDLMPQIESALEEIETCQDLLGFVDLLAKGAARKVFEDQEVVDYVNGISLVLYGLGQAAPKHPDWQFFGRILLSAFFR